MTPSIRWTVVALSVVTTGLAARADTGNFVYYGTGSGFASQGDWLPTVESGAQYIIADFNSDGFLDLLAHYSDANGTWHNDVYLGRSGPGFTFAGDWLPNVGGNVYLGGFNAAINAANVYLCVAQGGSQCSFPDLLFSFTDAGGVQHNDVYYGTGSGFAYQGDWLPGVGAGAKYLLADFNSDGLPDLLAHYSDANGTWHNDMYLGRSGPGFIFAGDWLPNVGGNVYLGGFNATINAANVSLCMLDGGGSQCAFPDLLIDMPPPITGTIQPQYLVTAIWYLPPGGAGITPTKPSYVQYTMGSTTGTTISTSSSYTNATVVSTSAGCTPDVSYCATLSFTHSSQTTTAQSFGLELQSTSTYTYPPGSLAGGQPPSDYIDHDQDMLSVWLGVNITVSVDASNNLTQVIDFSNAIPQEVRLGCLLGHLAWGQGDPCPDAVQQAFQQANIQTSDYSTMASVDPFAPNASVDGARYQYVEPAGGYYYDGTGFQGYMAWTSQSQKTHGSKTTTEVSATINEKGILSFLSAGITEKFTWTSTSSQTASQSLTDADLLQIYPPSSGYSGPDVIYLYLDTVYKTWMFSLTGPCTAADNTQWYPVPGYACGQGSF